MKFRRKLTHFLIVHPVDFQYRAARKRVWRAASFHLLLHIVANGCGSLVRFAHSHLDSRSGTIFSPGTRLKSLTLSVRIRAPTCTA